MLVEKRTFFYPTLFNPALENVPLARDR